MDANTHLPTDEATNKGTGMVEIQVKSNVLRGLLRVAAESDVRYYLEGVHFDPANGRIASTNGHCLLVVKTGIIEGVEPFIVPRALVQMALDLSNVASDCLVSAVRADSKPTVVSIARGAYTVSANALDGNFPQYGKAVPREPTGEPGNYNPRLLFRVQSALNDVCGVKNCDHFTLVQNGKEKAALLVGLDDTAFGVVMPLRADRDHDRAMKIVSDLGFPPDPKPAEAAA